MSISSPAGRPRVAVLFGGRSGEHAISCVTASGVLAALDRDRYDVLALGITRSGRWLVVDDDPAAWELRGTQLPEVTDSSARVAGAVLATTDTDSQCLVAVDGRQVLDLGSVDVVVPLLHGPYGEDGTVQGLLELAGVRYVGAGVLASATCMDKHALKVVLSHAGFAVADWETVVPSQWRSDPAGVAASVARLGAPVFVKPSRAGSSLGISRVADPSDVDALVAALEAAAEHDPKVLVEEAVTGREVECGVLGVPAGQGVPAGAQASVCGEVVVDAGRDFYDFEAKYLDAGAVRLDTPADLPSGVADLVRAAAVRAFTVLGCEGLARVDFFVDPDAAGGRQPRVVVNEVNTMPGFTPTSMYPRLWAGTGVDYPALVDRLVQLALERPAGLR